MRIELRVRRFFCTTDDCGQRIFTERFPHTIRRHGVGHAACLRPWIGSRWQWADLQDLVWRNNAAFGQMVQHCCESYGGERDPVVSSSPRVVGIDDWAWRKG